MQLKLIGVASVIGVIGLVATAVGTLTLKGDSFGVVESTAVASALGLPADQLDSRLSELSFRTKVFTVSTIHWECTGPGAGFKRNAIRSTTYAENTERQWVTRGRGGLSGFQILGTKGAPTMDSSVEGAPMGGCNPETWTPSSDPSQPTTYSLEPRLEVSLDGKDWRSVSFSKN